MMKKFSLSLRSCQFTYNNFSSLNGLACIGDVDVSSTTHAYKIISNKNHLRSGALWHSLKQRIENGFQTHFGFRFRNTVFHGQGTSVMNQSVISHQDMRDSTMMNNMTMAVQTNPDGTKTYQAAICLIIQTEREIAPWKKTAPQTTQDLNAYIAIKFITRIHGISTGQKAMAPSRMSLIKNHSYTQSLIQVWASSESKIGKIKNIIEEQNGQGIVTKNEVLIGEIDVTSKADFMDGYHHQVFIQYSPQEELGISLIDASQLHNAANSDQIQRQLTIPLKLSDFVELDNGTAYLGFCQETMNL